MSIGFWTEERVLQLRSLWARGDSCSVIAAEMGTTRNSVIGKAHRLKLESRVQLAGFYMREGRKTKAPKVPKRPHRDSVFKIPERKPAFYGPNNRRPPLIAVTSVMTGAFLNVKRGLVRQPEYTKDQLREQLAQAMLNTARLA